MARGGRTNNRRYNRPGRPLSMLRRLLLATDFSPAADAAWEFALDVAGQLRADVLLLHVAIPATLAATLPDRAAFQGRDLMGGSERCPLESLPET